MRALSERRRDPLRSQTGFIAEPPYKKIIGASGPRRGDTGTPVAAQRQLGKHSSVAAAPGRAEQGARIAHPRQPGQAGRGRGGALADLLLVDGDPLKNLKLIADPAKNFVVIMKDGKIYKNLIR